MTTDYSGKRGGVLRGRTQKVQRKNTIGDLQGGSQEKEAVPERKSHKHQAYAIRLSPVFGTGLQVKAKKNPLK